MTKFYFCGSIRGGRQLADRYQELIEWLQSYGQVLTEHVGKNEKTGVQDVSLTDREIHDRDLAWVKASDLVIAEVSAPSLGVGYEIARALQFGKTVWCLFHSDTDIELSAMIAGCNELEVIGYRRPEELTSRLEEFIKENI